MTTPNPAPLLDSAAHEQPTPPAALSTEQVETIVRHIAKAYLEVERGLRPPQHLEPHLTTDAYDRLRRRPRQAFAKGGPVGARDLGPVSTTTYPESGRVFASLTAREQRDRWGAMLIELRHLDDDRLIVSELRRVPMRPQARLPEKRGVPDLAERIRWVEDERDLVHAAHVAERERAPGDPASGHDAPATPHLSRLAELDDELEMLRSQEYSRQVAEANPHLARGGATASLTRLIGPRPQDGWRQLQWDSAHDAVLEYRQRYGVHDDSALGPRPSNPTQAADREVTADMLRELLHARSAEKDDRAREQLTPSVISR